MGDGDNPDPPISSGGGGDSSDSNREDEETQPTGLDDHTPDTEPEESDEVAESSTPSSGTPSTGGGSGAPAGAPVGVPPDSTPSPEDPTGEESRDGEEPETPEQPETEEDSKPERPDEQPDHEEDSDRSEKEDEDDDDVDEEDQVAQIVIRSDPWDSIGWGIYPVRLQLKEEYGNQIQFDDRLVPVREFSSPDEMTQQWEKWAPRHGMPVNTEVWKDDPPESAELADRAFAAAREQSVPLAKQFMRRLKTAAIVEGTNIEDRETLFGLAREVGLDTDQLEEDWNGVDLRTSVREVETPKTSIHVDGETVTQPGLVTANDLKTPLKRAGLEADDPQPLPGFVEEHGPVTTEEVAQVYDHSSEEALDKLQSAKGVKSVERGNTIFWDAV